MRRFLATLACLSAATGLWAQGAPEQLQCEHLTDPLGIDAATPRLSWRMNDPRDGARQVAYRLLVGTDSAALARGEGALWDTGRINSDASLVRYDGPALEPFTRYYWRVTTWGMGNEAADSPVAAFETGMMEIRNWQGCWIGDNHDRDYKPAPYFRKEFEIKRPVASARVYIAVGGLYELSINGQRIGDHRLDPLYTTAATSTSPTTSRGSSARG